MKAFATVVRVLGTLIVLIVGLVAYDYASRFFDQVLRLVFAAAPAGGKVQTTLSTQWATVVYWGEWAIVGLLALIAFILLRRVWGR